MKCYIYTVLQYIAFTILFAPVLSVYEYNNYNDVNVKNVRQEYYPPAPRAELTTNTKWIEESVERHNYYRGFHDVLPLKMNKTLSEISQAWAYQRARGYTGHNPRKGRIGENIYTICLYPDEVEVNASYFVDGWYNEVEFYDYETCTSNYGNEQIGHFTQLVWKDSMEVGVASAKYRNSNGWNCMVVVANYSPPGNVEGLCLENVFPKKDSRSSGSSASMLHFSRAELSFFILALRYFKRN